MTELSEEILDKALSHAVFDANRHDFLRPAGVAILNGLSLLQWTSQRNEVRRKVNMPKTLEDVLARDEEAVKTHNAMRSLQRFAFSTLRCHHIEIRMARELIYHQYLSQVWSGGHSGWIGQH